MEFSRQEYWSGVPFPTPGYLPDLGIRDRQIKMTMRYNYLLRLVKIIKVTIADNTKQLVQFSSVTQLCLTLCNPEDCSTPGLPVHHQLPELTQTHFHQVGNAIHILSSVIPFSSHLQSFPASRSFPRVSSLHQMAKVLAFQLQH